MVLRSVPEQLRTHHNSTVLHFHQNILTCSIKVWYGGMESIHRRIFIKVSMICGSVLPSIEQLYTQGITKRTKRITEDPWHPVHDLFRLHPLGTQILQDQLLPYCLGLGSSSHSTQQCNIQTVSMFTFSSTQIPDDPFTRCVVGYALYVPVVCMQPTCVSFDHPLYLYHILRLLLCCLFCVLYLLSVHFMPNC